MAAAVAVPIHKLYEDPNTRSIDVNGWSITACTNPISSAGDCDAMQAELGIPLPEMFFGSNSLTVHHRSSGWKYSFDALNALKAVKNGKLQEGDGGVKVGYADAWLKSRYVNANPFPVCCLASLAQVPTRIYRCLILLPPNRMTGRTLRCTLVTGSIPSRPLHSP